MTITAADLQETSWKNIHQQTWDTLCGKPGIETDQLVDPTTVLSGVFSLDQAQSVTNEKTPIRLTVYSKSTEKVCVIVPDYMYGWKVFKEQGWFGTTYGKLGTSHASCATWEEHISIHYSGYRVIETEEELVKYLNEGQ